MNTPISVEFTEKMRGFVTRGETDCDEGFATGKAAGTAIMFKLTIIVPDVDLFVEFPAEEGRAEGYVEWAEGGGRLAVERGTFNCFVDVGNPISNVRNMRYRLFLRNAKGELFTFSGHKEVKDDARPDLLETWKDTSTLFTQIFSGHVSAAQEASAPLVASGVLHIIFWEFLQQLTTFEAKGGTKLQQGAAIAKFGQAFLGNLLDVYAPHFRTVQAAAETRGHTIPQFTLAGVPHAKATTHPITTGDGLGLSLLRFQQQEAPEPDDVVMLLHGLTTSTDMFIMPEHKNLVTYLHEHGYTDVWSFDWRGSMRHPYNTTPNNYSVDDIALFDVPAAVAEIRRHIGPKRRLHVICHCVGSLGFMMSLYGKAVTGISSVVSNSISLVCRMPAWSSLKLSLFPFVWSYLLRWPTLNPNFATLPGPGIAQGKLFAKAVSLFHGECDVPACHMCSMMWGAGKPAMWQHENLADVTHRRTGDLFGAISASYFWHIRLIRQRGVAVKKDLTDPKYAALPNSYLDWASEIKTPTLFLSGEHNKVFADSNVAAHELLNKVSPGNGNELRVVKGYGHQDVFMGKDNDRDVFPHIVEFLRKHSR